MYHVIQPTFAPEQRWNCPLFPSRSHCSHGRLGVSFQHDYPQLMRARNRGCKLWYSCCYLELPWPGSGTIMGFAFKEIMKELPVISAFLSDWTILLFIISSYMHSQSNWVILQQNKAEIQYFYNNKSVRIPCRVRQMGKPNFCSKTEEPRIS